MRQKRIVTVQDLSCFGKCSLGVALPVISACGIEAVALPTAILSTHTGEFKNYTFCDLTDEMPKILKHWESLDIEFDAIYVGYLGSIHQLELVERFIDHFAKSDTVVFVDPVMADNGELYAGFDKAFVKEMKKLIKRADVICPNITEACFLTDSEYKKDGFDKAYIDEILDKLSKLSKNVILTSVSYGETDFGAVALCDGVKKEEFHEKIEGQFYGAGDLFASAFIGEYVKTKSFFESVKISTDFVRESILNTLDEKERIWYGLKFEECLKLLYKEK